MPSVFFALIAPLAFVILFFACFPFACFIRASLLAWSFNVSVVFFACTFYSSARRVRSRLQRYDKSPFFISSAASGTLPAFIAAARE